MELRYCEVCGDAIPVEGAGPIDPAARFVCERCESEVPAGGHEEEHTPARGIPPVSSDDLNLFSKKTIALRRQAEAKGGGNPDRAAGGVPPSPESPGTEQPRSARVLAGDTARGTAGSAAPAPEARKIVFRCLHCRNPLSVRPVKRTSRLACPACGGEIYITHAGQISKQPLSSFVRHPDTPPAREPARARETAGGPDHPKPRETAEEVALRRANPLASGVHPTGAFAVHARNLDPEKTFFLTEERTLGLQDLAGVERDVAGRLAARDTSHREQHPGGDLARDVASDLMEELGLEADEPEAGEPLLSAAGGADSPFHAKPTERVSPVPRPRGPTRLASRPSSRSAPLGGSFAFSELGAPILQGLAVAALVCAPFLFLATLHAPRAQARPAARAPAGAGAEGLFVTLGRTAVRGLARLGLSPAPRDDRR